jgi:hypothetical protein
MTAPAMRTRCTSMTEQRTANLKSLAAELATREMQADDVCAHLKMSPSGARKYIADLRAAGVMVLARHVDATPTYIGKAAYRLVSDQVLVSEFLGQIEQHKHQPRIPAPPVRALPVMPGRNFHIMADDTHYAVRINRQPAMRDPLVAALFGQAGEVRP